MATRKGRGTRTGVELDAKGKVIVERHTFDLPSKPDATALANPSRRLATAATRILQDGVTYGPNAKVPVTAKTHADLLIIGAILAVPWDELEPEPLPELALPVLEPGSVAE